MERKDGGRALAWCKVTIFPVLVQKVSEQKRRDEILCSWSSKGKIVTRGMLAISTTWADSLRGSVVLLGVYKLLIFKTPGRGIYTWTVHFMKPISTLVGTKAH